MPERSLNLSSCVDYLFEGYLKDNKFHVRRNPIQPETQFPSPKIERLSMIVRAFVGYHMDTTQIRNTSSVSRSMTQLLEV